MSRASPESPQPIENWSIENHPPLYCWFCDRPSPLPLVLENGILISREQRLGGPYRLFTCPHCLKEVLCEASARGRWFSSPNVKLGILDYLFTRAGGSAADEFSRMVLKAISWLRANEGRRRYFFERDGDFRYTGISFLKKLWPWGKEGPPRKGQRPGSRPGAGRPRAQDEARQKKSAPLPPPPKPRLITPHEILGLPAGASLAEVQRQFHRLAVQYHPDKVHHLGLEFQVHAHQKFVELKRAYEELRAESLSR